MEEANLTVRSVCLLLSSVLSEKHSFLSERNNEDQTGEAKDGRLFLVSPDTVVILDTRVC